MKARWAGWAIGIMFLAFAAFVGVMLTADPDPCGRFERQRDDWMWRCTQHRALEACEKDYFKMYPRPKDCR